MCSQSSFFRLGRERESPFSSMRGLRELYSSTLFEHSSLTTVWAVSIRRPDFCNEREDRQKHSPIEFTAFSVSEWRPGFPITQSLVDGGIYYYYMPDARWAYISFQEERDRTTIERVKPRTRHPGQKAGKSDTWERFPYFTPIRRLHFSLKRPRKEKKGMRPSRIFNEPHPWVFLSPCSWFSRGDALWLLASARLASLTRSDKRAVDIHCQILFLHVSMDSVANSTYYFQSLASVVALSS